jgi:hypothetical protein
MAGFPGRKGGDPDIRQTGEGDGRGRSSRAAHAPGHARLVWTKPSGTIAGLFPGSSRKIAGFFLPGPSHPRGGARIFTCREDAPGAARHVAAGPPRRLIRYGGETPGFDPIDPVGSGAYGNRYSKM